MQTLSLPEWQTRFEDWHRRQNHGDASHDYGHFRRVWQNCQLLLAEETAKADLAILLAASYFHDLINPPKDSPDRPRASALSADAAIVLLKDWQYPLNDAAYVSLHHVITAHSFSANITPETFEAKLFQDADRLEALGNAGIARMFCITGQMGRGLWDQDDPLAKNRPLDDKNFALDHIEVKLRPVSKSMQTTAGLKLAAQYMAEIDNFRDTLLRQIAPIIPKPE
jgi:uncharacterized protein